ncbi:MAG: hypothetical protein COT81_03380 [Candidatus Buchananbacteria bacterium CG10_big_fil_rev_8_21_14_0_10_42_9]|uniref:SSD domain-containing protein n=1 Tax=Candidatus Buchananbacteria bacterium CG10_big_fil_rev_8_21_14_0_10_42_9 TaxID=1974526 RepID=A0A2H0W0Z5_9BACT|nr:MAG: hypothetical protein COT81_03380 [Candidatus Buchananbacteria bacterium CG10_big_fil_rev_8_21_14_0_10_42_9]
MRTAIKSRLVKFMRWFSQRLINWQMALCVFLLATVVAGFGASKVTMEEDASVPTLVTDSDSAHYYQWWRSIFPNDKGTLVVLMGTQVQIASQESWLLLADMTDALTELPLVEKVDSLANATHITGASDSEEVDLVIGDFTTREFIASASDEDCAQLVEQAHRYDSYHGILINEDKTALGIFARAVDDTNAVEFITQTKGRLAQFEERINSLGLTVQQTGEYLVSELTSRLTERAAALLGLVMGLMFVSASGLTKSYRTGLVALLNGMFGALVSLALMGFTNTPFNPVNSLCLNPDIFIGTAFTIYGHSYTQSGDLWAGFVPKKLLKPFSFAFLTTAIGFASLGYASRIPAVTQFGWFGAAGVLGCAFSTLTFALPILSRPVRAKRYVAAGRVSSGLLLRVLTKARRISVLLEQKLSQVKLPELTKPQAVAMLMVIALYGVFGYQRLEVNYQPRGYPSPKLEVSQRLQEVEDRYGVSYLLQVVLSGDRKDPNFYRRVRTLTQALERDYPVKFLDVYQAIEAVDQAVERADTPLWSRPGLTREILAQYFLLLEWGGFDTEPLISYGGDDEPSILNLTALSTIKTSVGFNELDSAGAKYAQALGIDDAYLTGSAAEFFRSGDEFTVSSVNATLLAVIVIYVAFLVLLRSLRRATIAIICNIVPVVLTLGTMGWAGISLQLTSCLITSVALGLAVDDTAHYVARYGEHINLGLSPRAASRLTTAELRGPMIFTSVVIVLGSSVLNLADLVPYWTFTRVLTLAMALALATDLVLLPALLVHFDRPRFMGAVVSKPAVPTKPTSTIREYEPALPFTVIASVIRAWRRQLATSVSS